MKMPASFASLVGRRPVGDAKPPLDLSKLDRAWLMAERDRVLARAEAHAPPITRVLPVARAVTLGGETHVVEEFRLEDLAELQGWLEGEEPHPLDGIPPAWADPNLETRPARLADAWERARAWPPRLGTSRGAELLGSPRGKLFFLLYCLRRNCPAFGMGRASDLLDRISPAEWASLRRVVYGITAREELTAELDDAGDDAGPPDWCQSIHNAIQAHGCPDYGGIRHLHLSQWRNICAQGKADMKRPEFGAAMRRVADKLKGIVLGR